MKHAVFFLFLPCIAFAKPIPFQKNHTPLKVDAALKDLECQPVTISESGPISDPSKKIGKELSIALGEYKFVRTDIGDPDGNLKVYRNKKLICDLETSLLSGIKIVPSTGMLLTKWSSGSGNNWEIFRTGNSCASLGMISSADANRFESSLTGAPLKSCE